MVADDAGHRIIAMLQKAADTAKQDCQRAMDLSRTSSLPSYGLPRTEHESSRQRQFIFGAAPIVRRIGSRTFTVTSKRRFFAHQGKRTTR